MFTVCKSFDDEDSALREVEALIARCPGIEQIAWVQEEPRNMGAWSFIEPRLRELLPSGCDLVGYSRPEAASAATGERSGTGRDAQRSIVESRWDQDTGAPEVTPERSMSTVRLVSPTSICVMPSTIRT